MEMWPNFRPPLLFDVMAIATYLTGSSIFIYMGSIPDFAAVRDRTVGWRNNMYRLLLADLLAHAAKRVRLQESHAATLPSF